MTTKEVLQKAERLTISHVYDDGTYLLDILIANKAYVIRINLNDLHPTKD